MQSFVLLEAKRRCEREYVSFWTTMYSFVSSHCCKVVIPTSVIGQFSARDSLYGYSSENGVPVACLLVKVALYAKREGLATEEPELLVSFQESTGHV